MPYTVAMVVSTVGYHWEEVVGAYDEFTRAGWNVEFYTVNGARPRIDPVSIKMTGPLSMVGLGTSSTIAPQTTLGQEVEAKLRSVRSIAELNLDHLDALYLPGGHGCLFDLNKNEPSTLLLAISTGGARCCLAYAMPHQPSPLSRMARIRSSKERRSPAFHIF